MRYGKLKPGELAAGTAAQSMKRNNQYYNRNKTLQRK
jgi:hypothetical protein